MYFHMNARKGCSILCKASKTTIRQNSTGLVSHVLDSFSCKCKCTAYHSAHFYRARSVI